MVARESHKLTDGRFDSSSRNQIFLDSSAVEQQTVNLLVRGSIPRRGANFWSVRLSVRTLPFHGSKRGSIPLRSTIFFKGELS